MSRSTAVAARPAARAGFLARVWTTVQAHPYLSVFILALVVRVAIVLLISSYFSGQYVLDDATYDFMATDMAAGATESWDSFTHSLYWRTAAFLGPVTVIYKIFGPVKPIAQLFVALLGAGTAVVVTRFAVEYLARRWALMAGALIALLPSQAFWSSMLMKDAAVWLVLCGLATVVAIGNRSTGKGLVKCGVGTVLLLATLAFLREHTLVVAAWALMIASFFGMKEARWPRIGGAIAAAVIVPWLVASIGPAGLGLVTDAGSLADRRFQNAVGANTAVVDTSRVEEVAALEHELAALQTEAAAPGKSGGGSGSGTEPDPEIVARIQEVERALAEARSLLPGSQTAGTQAAGDQGLLDPNVRHIPRGVTLMLLEPPPIPFTGSFSLRLARLESLIWYPLLALALVGLWKVRPHLRQFAFPLVAGAGILLMYALTEGNVGTAHRHRGEFVWVVVLLAVYGAARLRTRPASTLETRP